MAKRDDMKAYKDAAERLQTLNKGDKGYSAARNVVKQVGRRYDLDYRKALGDTRSQEEIDAAMKQRKEYRAAVEAASDAEKGSKEFKSSMALVKSLGQAGGFNYQGQMKNIRAENNQPPPATPQERLSAGVYRGSDGSLMRQDGTPLPHNPDYNANVISNLQQMGTMQIPPNVPPMPKGGYRSQNPSPQEMEMINRIRSGNLPQIPGNNMISRSVNNAVGNIAQRVQQRNPQYFPPQQPNNTFNFGQGRRIQPNEYSRYGIDPRDPNQYTLLPDGRIMGTLIGWQR